MPDSFDLEFHKIFHRVSAVVNLKGAYGVNEVSHRIEQEIFKLEAERVHAEREGRKPPKGLDYKQEQLYKLLRNNRFARRTTSELVSNPDGFVAQVIRYGRKEAERRRLKRFREKRGRLRQVTRKRRKRRKR